MDGRKGSCLVASGRFAGTGHPASQGEGGLVPPARMGAPRETAQLTVAERYSGSTTLDLQPVVAVAVVAGHIHCASSHSTGAPDLTQWWPKWMLRMPFGCGSFGALSETIVDRIANSKAASRRRRELDWLPTRLVSLLLIPSCNSNSCWSSAQ